jgi:hypothetical protein
MLNPLEASHEIERQHDFHLYIHNHHFNTLSTRAALLGLLLLIEVVIIIALELP